MWYVYEPRHVCSRKFAFEVDGETIRQFVFLGGCAGNLQGIGRLLAGMTVSEAIDRFADMPVCPTSKVTSCPTQIREALVAIRNRDIPPQEDRPVLKRLF